ncbi:hypothetical protein [Sphingobacterium paludis]|uniref:Uncharacterized protein n=1 Tax=Sphingobacterium paludis TaxID=1476465 RepID=A0A4R7CQU8_9SPHI|nr:hypothetical protein [Sphingobacterium paludis]TDS07558.1 hypothetical protein B0I21_11348 [Sphingobacterium paludis]
MTRTTKTIVWINVALALIFILTILNEEFLKINFLKGVLTFVHELFIFPIAAIVILSTLYAVVVVFTKEAIAVKIGFLLTVLATIFLTFILPNLKNV